MVMFLALLSLRLSSDNFKRLLGGHFHVGSFSLERTGVIPQTALLAHLKEKFPWMEKSDLQDGDPCPCKLGVVPWSEFAFPQSSPCTEEE